ncbi:MAG: oxidoreductase, partial [Bacteroidetes bacterium SW_10_40_5]
LTQFSHFIDILYWVFGDVANVHATFSNFNHQEQIEFEDSGMVTFDFVKGGKGSINYSISCWEQNMESSITVIGEKGCLKVGGQYMNEISYFNVKDMEKPDLAATNPPNSYDGFMGSAGNHYQFLHDVIDHLKGRKSNGTNAYEAAKVVEIIDKTYQHRDLKELKAKANVNR